MEQEYKRDERQTYERLVLNTGGSSARVVSESEIDPAVLRRKQAECSRAESRYIDMFCERYRDRGIAGRMHTDAAKQEKKEALSRAITPGAYVGTEELAGGEQLDAYRSGISDGKRYMTADDFARYYHDQRGYKFPQYRTATDEERIAAVKAVSVASTRETRLEQPKKAGWLTDADKLPAFLQKLMSRKAFVWLNEWAGETFPRETEMRRESREDGLKRSRPIPAGLVAALVTVLLSMTMVISSTVSVSQATRDVSELKGSLAELKEVHGELEDQLDLKNDMLAIEDKASHELGMVHEKYLNGEYLTEEVEDRLEVYDEDRDGERKTGLAWLLSAFGIGD
jgi:cell division protein FtsB